MLGGRGMKSRYASLPTGQVAVQYRLKIDRNLINALFVVGL